MAAEFQEAGMVALCIAMGCAAILEPLLSFLEGAPTRSPVLELDAAVLFLTLTLPMAYLAGVILLHATVTDAASRTRTPVVLTAFRQFVLLFCAVFMFLTVAASLFPAAGGQ